MTLNKFDVKDFLANYWQKNYYESDLKDTKGRSSIQLDSYRAFYETEKYRKKVVQKDIQLGKETKREKCSDTTT